MYYRALPVLYDFSHSTAFFVLHCDITAVLYEKYSTGSVFDPPMQNTIKVCIDLQPFPAPAGPAVESIAVVNKGAG